MLLHLILLTQLEQEVRRSFKAAASDIVYLGRRLILSHLVYLGQRLIVRYLRPYCPVKLGSLLVVLEPQVVDIGQQLGRSRAAPTPEVRGSRRRRRGSG